MTVIDFNSASRQSFPRDTVDAEDIRARLNASARGFVQWLFSGRAYILRNGSEARIGDVMGNRGGSLSIQLVGEKVGLWHDHATGESGDLITLYKENQGVGFKRALEEIAAEFFGDPVKIMRAPGEQTARERIEAAKRLKGDKPQDGYPELGAPVATWRYFDLSGNIVASVERYEPDGTPASKTYRPWCFKDGKWQPGAPLSNRPLYNLREIVAVPQVVLCEGEKAAQALIDVGIVATTAMGGAEAPLDKTDWSPLHGKRIIIWPDNDAAGFSYARRVADRLAGAAGGMGIVDPTGRPPSWDAADCVAEGSDPRLLLDSASAVERPASRLRLLTLDEIEALPPPEWLIQGVITTGGLSMLWGKSETYKSFVALDMAMAVSTVGADWHGTPVKQGLVIYVAAEGAHGLARRAIGWRVKRGGGRPAHFRLVADDFSLPGEQLDELVTEIRAVGTPAMIILDTLNMTFGLGDESKSQDMSAYVRAAHRLRRETGAHVMIVHHAGKDDERGERGSSVLRCACDTIIKVERTGNVVRLINENPMGKQKDSDAFPTVTFDARKVAFERGGKEETTILLTKAEAVIAEPVEEKKPGRPTKHSEYEAAVIDTLQRFGSMGWNRILSIAGVPKTSLGRALGVLMEAGIVVQDPTTKNYTLIKAQL